MTIQLEYWKVINMNFSYLEIESQQENSFDLKSGNLFPVDNSKSFGVSFSLEVKDKSFNLIIEAVFMFNIDEVITEDFKLSSFPIVNAPAIAFPYLRAYVSNLTLQSGFDVTILPSINFVQQAEIK